MLAILVLVGLFGLALFALLLSLERNRSGPTGPAAWRSPDIPEVEAHLLSSLEQDWPGPAAAQDPHLQEVARHISYALATGAASTRQSLGSLEELRGHLHPRLVADIREIQSGPHQLSGPDPARAATLLLPALQEGLEAGRDSNAAALAVATAGRKALAICCHGRLAGSLTETAPERVALSQAELRLTFEPQSASDTDSLQGRLMLGDDSFLPLTTTPGRRPELVELATPLEGASAGTYTLQVDCGQGWTSGPKITLS